MKTRMKKITAAALAALLMLAAFLPASVYAADEPNTPKEEVVYASLGADGSVREINVVNIFELDGGGHIVDYGEYESIRNMTTTDALSYSGGKISAGTSADKLYYEGKLKDGVLPWKFEIRYYIDGEELSPKQAAGKSGKLKITVGITKNEQYKGGFFDGYALQASVLLDGDKCRNIVAEGATAANVGADRQLSYIVLPGKGADYTITADVVDFEIDGFSINGIPLGLSVEIDDSALNSEIARLCDAIKQIDDGAGALADGAGALKGGVDDALGGGLDEFTDGVSKLNSGAGELLTGSRALASGTDALYSGAEALDDGIAELNDGIEQIKTALDALDASSPELTEGSAKMKEALEAIKTALSEFNASPGDITLLTSFSSVMKMGVDSIASSAEQLRGAVSFDAYCEVMASGGLDVHELKNNNSAAIVELNSMVAELSEQINAMKAVGLDTSALEAQAAKLSEIAALLSANNANIDGMEAYLTTLGESAGQLASAASELSSRYAMFDSAIAQLADTLTTLLYKMSELKAAVNTLVDEYGKLDDGINEYTTSVAMIAAGFNTAASGTKTLLSGSGELVSGAKEVRGGASTLASGIKELCAGTDTLGDGTELLGSKLELLLDAISTLKDGADELHDGTSELRGETDDLEDRVGGKIDDMIGSITGDGEEVTSFVSDSNTEIKGVQFVIKTDGVHVEEAEEVVTQKPEELTFWQKLLRLFGLY